MSTLTNDQLRHIAGLVFNAYKQEIIKQGDWWFNLDEHTLNFFEQDNDGLMTVSVYDAPNNQTNYDKVNFSMCFQYGANNVNETRN
jgi:hypothetical protein